MAIAQVQKKSGRASAASVAVTFDSATTSGNLLVAVAARGGGSANVAISGWTSATGDTYGGGTAQECRILYKIADGTETTVTATATSAVNMSLGIMEYSGLTATPLDQVANEGSNSATAVTSRATGTTSTLSQAAELVIAAVGTGNDITGLSWSASFATQIDVTGGPADIHGADLVVSATTAIATTASWTTGRIAGGCIATFKASGGTDATATPSVIVTTSTLPAATVAAGSLGVVVTTTTSFPSGAVGAGVAAAVVATSSTFPGVAVSGGVAGVVITTSTSFPSGAVAAEVLAAAIATVSTLPQVLVSASVLATVIATISTLPTATGGTSVVQDQPGRLTPSLGGPSATSSVSSGSMSQSSVGVGSLTPSLAR